MTVNSKLEKKHYSYKICFFVGKIVYYTPYVNSICSSSFNMK